MINALRNRRLIIALAAVIIVGAGGFLVRANANYRQAQSQSCAGRLFPFTFVALQWVADNGNSQFPTNLTYLSNDVPVKWMICPSDKSRHVASSWSAFTPEHSSYELVSPGLLPGDTNSVFLRCKVHGHVSFADMTVFDGVKRKGKFEY